MDQANENWAPGGQPIRATDRERNDTCQVLDMALDKGQLSMEEHRQRVSAATKAVTLAELRALVSDLQTPQASSRRLARPPRRIPMAVWLAVVGGVIVLVVGAFFALYQFLTHGGQHPKATSPTPAPTMSAPGSGPTVVPKGGTLTDDGAHTVRTIACNDGNLVLTGVGSTYSVTGHCVSLTVSGFGDNNITLDSADTITVSSTSNTITNHACNNANVKVSEYSNSFFITGHCAGLTISSFENNVTVDSVDTVNVSSWGNNVTYHSGAPAITDTGDNNTVRRG